MIHPRQLSAICEYLKYVDCDNIIDPIAGNGFLAVMCMCFGMRLAASDIKPDEESLCHVDEKDATSQALYEILTPKKEKYCLLIL